MSAHLHNAKIRVIFHDEFSMTIYACRWVVPPVGYPCDYRAYIHGILACSYKQFFPLFLRPVGSTYASRVRPTDPNKQIQTSAHPATGCIGKTLDEGKPMPPPFPGHSCRTKQTNGQTSRQSNKQTDRQSSKQTVKQTVTHLIYICVHKPKAYSIAGAG